MSENSGNEAKILAWITQGINWKYSGESELALKKMCSPTPKPFFPFFFFFFFNWTNSCKTDCNWLQKLCHAVENSFVPSFDKTYLKLTFPEQFSASKGKSHHFAWEDLWAMLRMGPRAGDKGAWKSCFLKVYVCLFVENNEFSLMWVAYIAQCF